MKRGKPTFPHDQKIPRSSSEQELKALSLKEESAVSSSLYDIHVHVHFHLLSLTERLMTTG
jgi:hypothetical protein